MSDLKNIRELIDDDTLDEIITVMVANGYQQEWNDLMDHSRQAAERIEELGDELKSLHGSFNSATKMIQRLEAEKKATPRPVGRDDDE